MRYALLIVLISVLTDVVFAGGLCHACLDGICYTKSLIFKKHPVSGQLAIDRNENVIYFHYESRKTSDHTVAFDLDDIRFRQVPNIQFSFAKTVDQSNGDVYIGGASGLYKYNAKTNQTALYGLSEKTIWHMQYKSILYYTIFMTKGLFTYEKKQSKGIQALNNFIIDDFIIDKRGDVYFMTNFTVYKLKKGDKKPSLFSNVTYSLSTDIEDNAYFVQKQNRGLFKIDYRDNKLVEVGAFGSGSPFRIVFDKFNNIIYYDSYSSKLYYLLPNYALCNVKTEGKGKKQRKTLSRISSVQTKQKSFNSNTQTLIGTL